MEEILECVGIAVDLCGVPTLSEDAKAALESPEGADVASLIPDQIVCMAAHLPSIAQTSETCASLVESLIAIEQVCGSVFRWAFDEAAMLAGLNAEKQKKRNIHNNKNAHATIEPPRQLRCAL
jgi:hypothetical protein